MRLKSIIRTFMLIGISTILLLTAGCAGESNSDGDQVEISIMARWKQYNDLLKNELIPEFEEEHPDIKITDASISGDEYTQALPAAINGEDLPDIFAAHPSLPTYELYDQGVLHELDDVIEESKYDKDDFEKGTWTEGGTMMDDKTVGIPIYTSIPNTLVMFYNTEIMEEAGLDENDVPTSWDELVDVSKEIQDKTDAYGVFYGINEWTTGAMVEQVGSAISPEVSSSFNYHTGEYDYGSQGNIETAEFFKMLVDEGIDEPSDKTRKGGEGAGVFAAGKAAFFFSGTWSMKQFADDGFEDYGVAKIPTKDGKDQYVGNSPVDFESGLYISKHTEHYEEAKKFLTFLMDRGYEETIKSSISYSPVPDVNEKVDMDNEKKEEAMKLKQEISTLTPDALLNNIDAYKVKNKMSGKGADMDVVDVVEGYVKGQVDDLEGTFQEMTDKENKAFQEALKNVKDSGVEVDESDWKFPDWEPFTPYEK